MASFPLTIPKVSTSADYVKIIIWVPHVLTGVDFVGPRICLQNMSMPPYCFQKNLDYHFLKLQISIATWLLHSVAYPKRSHRSFNTTSTHRIGKQEGLLALYIGGTSKHTSTRSSQWRRQHGVAVVDFHATLTRSYKQDFASVHFCPTKILDYSFNRFAWTRWRHRLRNS